VAVRDVTDASWLSRGKQASDRGGIWYTPQSGIWQTVWLEVLPRRAVDRLVLVPDLEAGTVIVTVLSSHESAGDLTAQVLLTAEGMPVADAIVEVGVPTPVALAPPIRTWSPDDPFLYDVEVRLGEDRATSYVGMRSFGVGTDARGIPRLLLNGRPFLPIGLLDQGYWPDGGYTAPADAALEYDVTLAKALGYNMLRKHIKVEPLRWYHH
jgi:beta-galactosidase/beta-glucuronidase